MSDPDHLRRGVTLVEVLVVIGIIAALIGLLFPAVLRVREAGNATVCRNNLHQLVIALHHYHEMNGTMPPYATGGKGVVSGNWFVYMLPQLDQMGLANDLHVGQRLVPDRTKHQFHTSAGDTGKRFAFLLCPSDPTGGLASSRAKTNYEANWYAFGNGTGGFYPPPQSFQNLTNGLSNVVLFGECYSVCNLVTHYSMTTPGNHTFGITLDGKPSDDPSYLPNDYTMFQINPRIQDCDRLRTQAAHSAMNIALADGSVRSVARSIDPQTWKKVLKPQSGGPGGDW